MNQVDPEYEVFRADPNFNRVETAEQVRFLFERFEDPFGCDEFGRPLHPDLFPTKFHLQANLDDAADLCPDLFEEYLASVTKSVHYPSLEKLRAMGYDLPEPGLDNSKFREIGIDFPDLEMLTPMQVREEEADARREAWLARGSMPVRWVKLLLAFLEIFLLFVIDPVRYFLLRKFKPELFEKTVPP